MSTNHALQPPKEILIVGAGVFGLSTALALLDRAHYTNSRILIIDSANTLPNPVGSSVDASRIIRADYAQYLYAKLACLAQEHWRDQKPSGWGGEGRYHESGFVLTGDAGHMDYISTGKTVVEKLAMQGLPMQLDKIQELADREQIKNATALPGTSGDSGYVNWNSGWADAEASVAHALNRIKDHPNARDRVTIRSSTSVSRLNFGDNAQCTGVEITDGHTLKADLTILATGAWTPSLIGLQNRCLATGQALAYVQLSQEEQEYLEKRPVIINFSRGTFIIPPQNREFKIARHGYGYRNPITASPTPINGSDYAPNTTVSVPRTDTDIPAEAERYLREGFAELFPPNADPSTLPTGFPRTLLDLSTRPFTKTRLCWYTDTPTGNFLIDYPPLPSAPDTPNTSLFIATGGSGHGFKFFPILGSYILDAIDRTLDAEYAELWRWPTDAEIKEKHGFGTGENAGFLECRDGSRGGPTGLLLNEELRKGMAKI